MWAVLPWSFFVGIVLSNHLDLKVECFQMVPEVLVDIRDRQGVLKSEHRS